MRYNKNMQEILDINLYHYKTLSGKYIINELNGKTKEYDGKTDKLVFEGEYKDGKRNGKGKEYDLDGILIFEGEYKDGKRSGKGKQYNVKGNISFEGEYLKGKEWNGKRYNYFDNKVMYELKNGAGHVKFSDPFPVFESEYINGEKNGKGFEYGGISLIFEGEYKNGLRWNGKGYDNNNKILYELINGNGYVKEQFFEHIKFEGEYKNGKRNGKGKEFNYGELIFEGEYLNGKRNGKGKEYNHKNELIFEGEYLYNHKKKGKQYINNKLEYEGDYLFDKKWEGKGYDKNGNLIYGLEKGKGKVKEYFEYNCDLLYYEGEYLNGKKMGMEKNLVRMVNI